MQKLLKLINKLQSKAFKWRLNRKINEAEKLRKQTRAHYLVISDGRKILVYRRRLLRTLIAQKYFDGIKNIEQLERKALYSTK